MLEAQGLRVHVHISPHLVRFHERIRIAGELISEDELAATLEEVERVNAGRPITFFEITNAAMFLAFSRHPADAVVLEVGLGGTYDATNVIDKPAMTIVQPVGLDHLEFLGHRHRRRSRPRKPASSRPRVPVVVGPQDDARAVRDPVARRQAERAGLRVRSGFLGASGTWPHGLSGRDGPARSAAAQTDRPPPDRECRRRDRRACGMRISGWGEDAAVEKGLRTVEWPARLQRLTKGPLIAMAPKGAEVWLDGGHNPHCAAAVSRAIADLEERSERPLYLICGMLRTKDAVGFLSAFRGLARHVVTVTIPGEAATLGAGALYDMARTAGLDAAPAEDLEDAMLQVAAWSRAHPKEPPPRILICGSLYLAGTILKDNS